MRGRAGSVATCVGLVLLFLAALAPTAQAEWLPPVDISEESEHTGAPHVVLDSEGNATAVWDRWNGVDTVVESAYRPAGEGWEAPTDLSEPELEGEVVPGAHDASAPRIAVDRNGNVTVIWERYAGVNQMLLQAVERPAGGSWTAPVDIAEFSQGVAPEPWIAVDWEGNATAVWKQGEVITSSFHPFAGAWSEPIPLSEKESFTPQAAMDARGDTTVVWMHDDGSHYVVESAYRPEGGEWEEPTLVSKPDEEGGNPHVALDAKGDSLVVWRGAVEGEESVRAAYRPQGEPWSPATSVSSPGEQVRALHDAVDPAGNAIVAWSGDMGKVGEYEIAHAAFKPVEGSWEAPVELSEGSANAAPSDVVFDTSGNAALIWQRWDSTTDLVQATYRPAGGEWEPAVDLSEEGKQSYGSVVVLDAPGSSTAADGNATAVWISETPALCEGGKPGLEENCPTSVVQAAGYDPEGLPEVELEIPAEGTAGEPVEISTPTEGLFAPLLEFGDGESVADTEATHVYEDPGKYEVTLGGAEVLGYRASVRETITIAPAGTGGGGDGEKEAKPGEEGKATAEPPPGNSGPSPSATCLAAEATRDAALHRLRVLGGRLARAKGTPTARRLAAAKRKQAARLAGARQRAAAAC
ncbi:MAG TPA: PKD domain-containing protein [Solirubrobacterales bacterium]|nr:PKD domain-containing protein [Solirubrobacterales bacterium]